MLLKLQNRLAEKTDGVAIESVPEIPQPTSAEVATFMAEMTNTLEQAVNEGKSSFDFVMGTRQREDSNHAWSEWTSATMDERDRYNKFITHYPAIPDSIVLWWRNCQKKVSGYQSSLPRPALEIAAKRRDDLFFDYLSQLVRIWSEQSDVPARVLRTTKSEYHDGSYCYPRERSYTKYTESVGITFDWTPTTNPEVTAARIRVTRCETKLAEARDNLNNLIAAESPTKKAKTMK